MPWSATRLAHGLSGPGPCWGSSCSARRGARWRMEQPSPGRPRGCAPESSARSSGSAPARVCASPPGSWPAACPPTPTPQVVDFCAGLLSAGGALVALALIDLRLCLTFLAGMPLLLWALHSFAGRASGIAQRYLSAQGSVAGRLVDALGGARTIAAAGTVDQ